MKFDVDELLPFCEKCHASGEMDNPQLQSGEGVGTRVITQYIICDDCDGHGVIITENADALIKFFKRAKSKQLLDL